jgi:hypothetical protein
VPPSSRKTKTKTKLRGFGPRANYTLRVRRVSQVSNQEEAYRKPEDGSRIFLRNVGEPLLNCIGTALKGTLFTIPEVSALRCLVFQLW